MVDFYGKLVGRYTVRPMDPSWGNVSPSASIQPFQLPGNVQVQVLESQLRDAGGSLGELCKAKASKVWLV